METSVVESMSREEKAKLIDQVLSLRNVCKGLPGNFFFAPDGSKLFFTGCEANQHSSSLYYVDLTSTNTQDLDWIPFVTVKDLENTFVPMSKEEELLRERQRLSSTGITSFEFNAKTQRFLIPASGRFTTFIFCSIHHKGTLYTVSIGNTTEKPLPQEVKQQQFGARMDAKFSEDGSLVAFVRNGEVWVYVLSKQQEVQLTKKSNENSFCGVAEFVMQEEFDRYTGYWWSPVVDLVNEQSVYRILYLEVDESDVSLFRIPENDIEGSTEDHRYPLAGQKNAMSKMCLVEFDEHGRSIKNKVLFPSVIERFPWCEYIVRCGWLPDGKRVWAQLLDRKQQRLVLVTFGVEEFHSSPPESIQTITPTIITEETSKIWVNVSNILYTFDDGERLIWASERTGFRHLYLINIKTNECTPITSGPWQVADDGLLGVDQIRGLVYFTATKESPVESHLYVASFTSPSSFPITRLTEVGYTNNSVDVHIDKQKTLFVSKFSNVKTVPQVAVFSVNVVGSSVEVSKLFSIKSKNPEVKLSFPITSPEIFSFVNTLGLTIYGALYKPANFDAQKKYPTICYVYGGPHAQLVTNDFENMVSRMGKFHLYTHLGFVVVIIDGIGSANRGLEFEGHLRNCMGTVEVRDQVEGLTLLASQGIVDLERVCVTGWSYGGYLSLMCLAQRPDIFRLAIAGAPVTLWESYDTGYTERYMDTPQNNLIGYKRGSVIEYAAKFPKEPNRLLLIHGLKDENVHFCNTSKLVEALINHNKPYDLAVYPKERHGMRSLSGYVHLETKILSYLHLLATKKI